MATTLALARRLTGVALLALLLLLALPGPAHAQPGAMAIPFAQTNGNVLASLVIPAQGAQALAITGNFTSVKAADGTVQAARNFAVLAIPSGRLVFTAPLNSYGRALAYGRSRLYVGGDFTSVAGYARARVASFSTVTWGLSGFNPALTTRVWALAFAPQRNAVIVGSSSGLRAGKPDTATVLWTMPTGGGPVRALAIYPAPGSTQDLLYVGGLFESLGTLRQHGLARVNLPAAGLPVLDPVFRPVLRPDSGIGPRGTDDGQAVLSLTWKLPDLPLIVGWGGASTNGVLAMNQITGAVWWTQGTGTSPGTPGDVQALVSLPDSILVGYHRNHVNDTAIHWRWYGSALNPGTGALLAWDPKLTGLTSANIGDSNPGGVTSWAVDTVNHLVFAGGGFRWTGANCPGTVFPCVNERGTPSQSLAMWRY